MNPIPEVWLRGPIPGIIPMLQPVAQALLQAREEINMAVNSFPADKLWSRPAGVASVGFHLKHIPGVLDRLSTYANAQQLSPGQMEYLQSESRPSTQTAEQLLSFLSDTIEKMVAYLEVLTTEELVEARSVGRKGFPSTVLGLLFHAAEHTMRHTGQLLVTVAVVRQGENH